MLQQITTFKDQYLYRHQTNVSEIAYFISKALDLDSSTCETVRKVAQVHDIGKIGIPNEILFKPGKLTKREIEIVRLHPITGAELLNEDEKYVSKDIIDSVLQHHEWWNGCGYPKGLSGEKINIIARIVSVADAFDAITTSRPYRKARTSTEAIEEIIQHSGTQFDPDIVKVFYKIDWVNFGYKETLKI